MPRGCHTASDPDPSRETRIQAQRSQRRALSNVMPESGFHANAFRMRSSFSICFRYTLERCVGHPAVWSFEHISCFMILTV